MPLCEENQFDVLLTIDKNLMFQQNLEKYNVTIAVLNCKTSKIEDLKNYIANFKSQITLFEKSKAYLVDEAISNS